MSLADQQIIHVKVECKHCFGCGIRKLSKSTAAILCIQCQGTGYQEINQPVFTELKVIPGVETVSNIWGDGKISYFDFLAGKRP